MGVLAASAFATSRSETNLPSLNQQVVAAVNSFRVAHGLAPLRASAALDRSARRHSFEMGRVGDWRRPRPTGLRSGDGSSAITLTGYRYWSVGENLLGAGGGERRPCAADAG